MWELQEQQQQRAKSKLSKKRHLYPAEQRHFKDVVYILCWSTLHFKPTETSALVKHHIPLMQLLLTQQVIQGRVRASPLFLFLLDCLHPVYYLLIANCFFSEYTGQLSRRLLRKQLDSWFYNHFVLWAGCRWVKLPWSSIHCICLYVKQWICNLCNQFSGLFDIQDTVWEQTCFHLNLCNLGWSPIIQDSASSYGKRMYLWIQTPFQNLLLLLVLVCTVGTYEEKPLELVSYWWQI